MNQNEFLEIEVSDKDTVTVSALEIQKLTRAYNELVNGKKGLSIDYLNKKIADLEYTNKQLVIAMDNINSAHEEATHKRLVKIYELQKEVTALEDKVKLGDSLRTSLKDRVNSLELTKPFHIDISI